jgi:hypothetical protein
VHANGISIIEGFVGNSLGDLESIGVVTGTLGALRGDVQFTELDLNDFYFNSTKSGTIFQFVVRETTLENGWANYHAIPFFTPASVPDVLGGWTALLTLAGMLMWHRKIRAS